MCGRGYNGERLQLIAQSLITLITIITLVHFYMHTPSYPSENGNVNDFNEGARKFSRYLVIDSGSGGYRIRGIRSDAPKDMIDEFVDWYRDNNRYENGRLRPERIVRKSCIVQV